MTIAIEDAVAILQALVPILKAAGAGAAAGLGGETRIDAILTEGRLPTKAELAELRASLDGHYRSIRDE